MPAHRGLPPYVPVFGCKCRRFFCFAIMSPILGSQSYSSFVLSSATMTLDGVCVGLPLSGLLVPHVQVSGPVFLKTGSISFLLN
jgi:hypothetical protein